MSAAQGWRMTEIDAGGRGVTPRAALLVSADVALRQRLKSALTQLRWTVREAGGGAAAMAMVEFDRPEAIIVDGWLPDLEAGEFAREVESLYPEIEMVRVDGAVTPRGIKSPRHNELLHALRVAQEADAPEVPLAVPKMFVEPGLRIVRMEAPKPAVSGLPEMIGESAAMMELARLIRLVAPKPATVLIEGETGTGKEVVAKAVHRLSARAGRPFVVLNCAAIPESLLEAELFGHTRGAFTGAVASRMGRIEAAHGGTLFLDEIGEMLLALQAKMLRFLESGELQKVGENESTRVDVRVVAATHQELERRVEEKTFRLDLYHRLAVFPLEVPPLRDRMEDLPLLVEFFLEQMGKAGLRKQVSGAAMARLMEHAWPGNVRELMHVLERGAILAEERAEIGVEEIRLRGRRRG